METSWTTEGDLDTLVELFSDFPDWCKRLFKHAPELGLWQLRDLVRIAYSTDFTFSLTLL